MIPFPSYLPDQNALAVAGIPTPFPAGSLIALRQDDLLAISSPVDGSLVCAWAPFGEWVKADGTAFDTVDAAFAFLDAACRQKRTVGEIFGVATVVGVDVAQGMPLAVSRATGRLLPARADTYALAFVAGLAEAATSQGYAAQPAHGVVTLADWTSITGSETLLQGVPYFLGAAGGLAASPPTMPGSCVTRVGLAVSAATLVVAPTDPITL